MSPSSERGAKLTAISGTQGKLSFLFLFEKDR